MPKIYRSLPIFIVSSALLILAGIGRSDDAVSKLPADMTKKEKKDLAALEKAVDKGKADLQKHQDKLVAYFTADYPDTKERLESAGFPGTSAGVPGGTKFQPGAGRVERDYQIQAAKQKAIHAEAHKALEPLIAASKDEIASKTKEAKDAARKAKRKADAEVEKIKVEATKRYSEKALPICEKYADAGYRKDKKNFEAKLSAAERELKKKQEAIIKAHGVGAD
jgi:hypothetical protein